MSAGFHHNGPHGMGAGPPGMFYPQGRGNFPRHPRGMGPVGRHPRGRGHPRPPRGYVDHDCPYTGYGMPPPGYGPGQGAYQGFPPHMMRPRGPPPRGGARGPAPGPGQMPPHIPPPYQDMHGHGQKRKLPSVQTEMKKKKQKIDSRDLPENNKFVCETCDRGFKTEEKFSEHVAGHQKCRVEGCQYTAAPKLVQLHYDFQHRTGLASKIWKLESEEDIAKWIADRKKNFPTKDNIERKQAERSERQARGEVLDNKYFGKMRGRGRGRGRHQRGRSRGQGRWNNRGQDYDEGQGLESINPVAVQSPVTKESLSEPVEATPAPASPVRDPTADPLSYLLNETDKEDSSKKDDNIKPDAPKLAGALGTLAMLYAGSQSSSDEASDDENKPIPPSPRVNSAAQNVNQNTVAKETASSVAQNQRPEDQVPVISDSGDTGFRAEPGHVDPPPVQKDRVQHEKSSTSRRMQQRQQQNQHRKPQFIPKKRLTLLEKLLAPEIRHERNVILQCVRYIVKNKFFGRRKVEETERDHRVCGEENNRQSVSGVDDKCSKHMVKEREQNGLMQVQELRNGLKEENRPENIPEENGQQNLKVGEGNGHTRVEEKGDQWVNKTVQVFENGGHCEQRVEEMVTIGNDETEFEENGQQRVNKDNCQEGINKEACMKKLMGKMAF